MKDGAEVVLGISCDFHDAAASLVVDGRAVAAAAEERFTRRKHDASLPALATEWCLSHGGIAPDGLDLVVFYEKPLSALERILATHSRVGPRGLPRLTSAVSAWASSKVWIGSRIERMLRRLSYRMPDLVYAEHHESHAAAAFYPSPFETSAVITFDGVGEWATTSIGRGSGSDLELLCDLRFPDSSGLLYSTLTAHCGFEVNDGEYKLMGLAPYGRPRYAELLRQHVVHVADDGSIALDQRYFDYRAGATMGSRRLAELLGPVRAADEPITQVHADIARSAQEVLEDIVLQTARHAHALTGEQNLCLAGGVALNCVANGRLHERGPFDDIWVQPASGDDGSALGAALWGAYSVLGRARDPEPSDAMSAGALGPSFSGREVTEVLEAREMPFAEYPDDELFRLVAEYLSAGMVVGWFRGRMEFGPRALGHRSILADPRDPAMIQRINMAVKGREGFRPFAPAVLSEEAPDWFETTRDLPYMLATVQVRGASTEHEGADDSAGQSFAERLATTRSPIPACTHVDGSARVQTVARDRSPDFHGLLSAFMDLTGCPVLLNTSFNRNGEPIVCTPGDAVSCFLEAGLDVLVAEQCVVRRSDLDDVERRGSK